MTTVVDAFKRMGVRARVELVESPGMTPEVRRSFGLPAQMDPREFLRTLRIDIGRDDRGEFFDVRYDARLHVRARDVRPSDRHLLLEAEAPVAAQGEMAGAGPARSVFLCGHDEKAWFVAAIPESADARDVQAAKDALKPQAVWDAMREFDVPLECRDTRKNPAFVRQGEWFFIRRPGLKVSRANVLRDEPIQRGGGKPHVCQMLYQFAGERVWVHPDYPNGLIAKEFWKLPAWEREDFRWHQMQRNAKVFVKGNVRHTDHKTVFLQEWHEVVLNTETEAEAMRQVAFLD